MQQGEKEVINYNLTKYIFIPKFLGSIIERRLSMPSYKYGMLTSHLLNDEEDEEDEGSLMWFEEKLESFYLSCANFEQIFQENELSRHKNIDLTIRKMLVQIKVVDLLLHLRFKAFTKTSGTNASAVDFTAQRYNQNYAVVVSLGLTESDENQCDALDTIIQTLEQQSGKAIAIGISETYPRINDFCQRRIGEWRGIIVISIGYDYLASPLYRGKGRRLQRHVATELIRERWTALKENREDYKYLSHLVLIDGQDRWHIYPSI